MSRRIIDLDKVDGALKELKSNRQNYFCLDNGLSSTNFVGFLFAANDCLDKNLTLIIDKKHIDLSNIGFKELTEEVVKAKHEYSSINFIIKKEKDSKETTLNIFLHDDESNNWYRCQASGIEEKRDFKFEINLAWLISSKLEIDLNPDLFYICNRRYKDLGRA